MKQNEKNSKKKDQELTKEELENVNGGGGPGGKRKFEP